MELIIQTNKTLEILHNHYKNFQPENYHEIFSLKEKIGKDTEDAMMKGSFEDIAMRHYLLDLTTLIQDSATVCLALGVTQTTG